MGSKVCMNASCRATASPEWMRGWALLSGGFANLCYYCGSAYEKSVFCNTFHLQESGWRQCSLCNKPLHCGCVASKSLIELLDYGGVGCIDCERLSRLHSVQSVQIQSDIGLSNSIQHRNDLLEAHNKSYYSLLQSQKGDTITCFGKIKQEKNVNGFQDLTHISVGSSKVGFSEEYIPSFLQTTIYTPSSFRHGQIHRQILPKPSKCSLIAPSELNNNKSVSHVLPVLRSHGEGRVRNQLLPRYWPRITDQELQQLSGDLNSTIVPLFEKILSASDAGRIGRLVLPKACAEAYFPPISQSEGLPITIQDVNGREWTFQFRFWPNNNSRMYVLEGVTPCIHSLQLQAGDTVTFSRIDPAGKLVMGFRKSLNSIDMQDIQKTCGFTGEPNFPRDPENSPNDGDRSSSLQQSLKGSTDYQMNAPCEQTLNNEIVFCDKKENIESLPPQVPNFEISRNIGSKTRRLLMHSEDALKLRVTWEEAQDLLRPPPTAKPSIVVVENHEFEEYDEPPVFGKRTFFVAGSFGEQEQWGECDNCGKWRKLPVEVLLPPNWVCSENVWDLSRCSCIEPEEKRPQELDGLLGLGKGLKNQGSAYNRSLGEEYDDPLSGLDSLATAAVLGQNNEPSEATTKHPRHRPGCTCIVCIQPPSGKNRHESTCACNVCSTVKRRFKTLTMRKKMRLQSEKEEEEAGVSGCGELGHPQGSEGGIDLNCEPCEEKGRGGASMTSLVKAASFPLDVYLKEMGLASLACGRKTILEEDEGEGEEEQMKNGGESRVDDECDSNPRL